MKKLQFALITLIVVTLVSCSKTEDDLSEDSTVLKADDPVTLALRKFEGTISGWMQDNLVNTCADPYKTKYFEGSGPITPVGLSKMTIDYCAFTENDHAKEPPFYGVIENGSIVFINIDGDKIFATLNGKYVIDRMGKRWINTITAYDNIILGGTGRYQHASGRFDIRGWQDLGRSDEPVGIEGRTEFTFEGTISYHSILPTSDQSNPDFSGQ